MKYSKHEVIQFVQEEDIKFIRLAFCDVFGRQKNIAIMPEELADAITGTIAKADCVDQEALDSFNKALVGLMQSMVAPNDKPE